MSKALSMKMALQPSMRSSSSETARATRQMEQHLERIQMALGAMTAAGPRNLRAYLEQPGPDVDRASSSEVDSMIDLILSTDPNHPARLLFSNLLRTWDNVKDARWTSGVDRNTAARRKLIHELLHSA